MTLTHKWLAAEAITTALSTELDALGSAAYSNASGAIDNSVGLYPFLALELYLASLTPVAGQDVAVYALYCLDGTNYEDGGGAVAPAAATLIAVFDLSTSAGVKWRMRTGIAIDPFPFKLVAYNKGTTVFAATGNLLRYRRYYDQMV